MNFRTGQDYLLLTQLAPKLFPRFRKGQKVELKPLKTKILNELLDLYLAKLEAKHKYMSKSQARKKLHFALKNLTDSSDYLVSLIENTHRYDINGEPVEEILAEHKETAKLALPDVIVKEQQENERIAKIKAEMKAKLKYRKKVRSVINKAYLTDPTTFAVICVDKLGCTVQTLCEGLDNALAKVEEVKQSGEYTDVKLALRLNFEIEL